MKRVILPLSFVTVLGSCLKLDATSIGDSETTPLVRVDGSPPPKTITDGSGAFASIVSGSLTVFDSRAECDYEIVLSSGKKIPGATSCLSGTVTPITGGVQLHLNLAAAGAPQGSHDYDFVGSQKPCSCPKFCTCGANRLTPESRLQSAVSADARRERAALASGSSH